jgi:UDP:flavonoid glycosyltransferase YjiC (YdhE family)
MRMLFSFVGGSGHAEPLVPLARAARAAGHAVAFSGNATAVQRLSDQGFEVLAAPAGRRDAPRDITPLVEFDPELDHREFRAGFADTTARRRADIILGVIERWRPDVIVCDEIDYGAMVAAERAELPRATVLVIAAGAYIPDDLIQEPLNALRAEHGLAPDPRMEMLRRGLVLSTAPPSLRDPGAPLPPAAQLFQANGVAPSVDDAPPWLRERADTPLIYFTLGTHYNAESGDLFSRVLEGVSALDVRVLATVGPHVDPAILGPQPDTVHVASFVAQAAVLPHCAAVITHGGSGSVMGALAHGVPLAVVPMGADQPDNARRCEALGVGIALDTLRATPKEIGRAVSRLLDEPAYRASARRLQEHMQAMPSAEQAVERIVRLVETDAA